MNLDEADLSKENIQPLRQGRIVGHLGTALQAQHDVSAVHELNAEKAKFELLLRTYDGDDPLQPWYDYIEWVEQTYIKHGREGNLVPLLENCLAQFKDDFKYSQDVRYVKLWIKYIDMANNPLELYNQMFSHGIGTLCAIFYRSWADELFQNGDYKRADKVYINGLKVRAQPLEELETAHDNFQIAVARRMLDRGSDISELQPNERRQAGNVLNTFGSKHKVTSQRIGSHVSQHHPGVLKPKNDETINRNTNERITVFDEGDSENKMPESQNKMQTGPKHNVLVKENTKKPGPWNGVQVKTSTEHVKMKPSFPVHEENLSPQKNNYKAEERLSALKPKKADGWLCPLAIFEPHDPSKRAMYPKDKVYTGGTEYSLEELRAVRYLKRKKENKDLATDGVQQTNIKEYHGSVTEEKDIAENCSVVKSDVPNIYSDQNEITASLTLGKCNRQSESIDIKPKQSVAPTFILFVTEEKDMAENCSVVKSDVPNIYSDQNEITASLTLGKCNRQSESTDIKPKQSIAPTFTLFVDEEEDCPKVINSQERAACPSSESTSNVSSKENVFSRQLFNFAEQPICKKEQKMTECIPTASMLKITKRKHTISDKTENAQNGIDKTTDSLFKIHAKQDSSIHSHTVNTEEVLKVVNECWTTPKQKKIDSGLAVEKRGDVVKEKLFLDEKCNVEIPRVPSPGMNEAELKQLEGTENKENDVIKPFIIKNDESDDEELAQPLDIENTFKKPYDKVKTPGTEDNWFHRSNHSERYLDDTCTTQLFSQSLISSTPIRKSLKLARSIGNEENLPIPTEQLIEEIPEKDSVIKNTLPEPTLTKIETVKETLSVILENSKEYKSSISSGSSSVVTRETYNFQSWRESHAVTTELSKISEVSSSHNDLESSKAGEKATIINNMHRETGNTVKSLDCIPIGNIDPFDPDLNKNILKCYNYPHNSDFTIVTEDRNLPNIILKSTINLGRNKYCLSCVLGEGAYAKVYCGMDEKKHKVALKVLKQRNFWELYITEQIKNRLKSETLSAFFSLPLQSYVFSDGIIFASECCEFGTLINVINLWKADGGKCLPECLCFSITRELLRILQILHECKIIHSDFKPDNILVKSLFPLSLKLTDFGRSIDLNCFPEGTKFTTVITTDDMKCVEMRSNLPWTYQVDFFGLVGIVHCLIFGDYMKLINRGSWKFNKSVPRWFNRDVWNIFFNHFLNIESCEKLPDLQYWIDTMSNELEKASEDYFKAQSNWEKIKKQIS